MIGRLLTGPTDMNKIDWEAGLGVETWEIGAIVGVGRSIFVGGVFDVKRVGRSVAEWEIVDECEGRRWAVNAEDIKRVGSL